MRERWQKSCSVCVCVCVCVWKHTLADLIPPWPETPLQNREVKPSAFLKQEQEPQPFTHKPSDSLGKQKRPFPLKPADRFRGESNNFLVHFAGKETNLFSVPAVSPSQTKIIYQYEALNRLSGLSDARHITMLVPICQITAPVPASSKGGSLSHASH